MSTIKSSEAFLGIQVLRLFAALLVVLAHTTQMMNDRMSVGPGIWENGTAGVDVFFVISGFVMALTASQLRDRTDGWRDFLTRRVVRVMPMYWIATTLKIGMIIAIPAMARHAVLAPGHLIASYLLVPWPNPQGNVFPILTVGWTLTFEMLFYGLVAAALFLRKSPLAFCTIVFSLVAVLGLLLNTTSPVTRDTSAPMLAVRALLDPLVIEFILGMAIAKFLKRPLLPFWLTGALLLAATATLLLGDGHGNWRAFAWGIPAATVVACTVQLESFIRPWAPNWLLQQGDASYSLYLFHPFILPIAGLAFLKLNAPYPLLIIAACLIISLLSALAVHLALETPITTRLRKLTTRKLVPQNA